MSSETEIALLTHKVESLHEDMGEMKMVMRDVASALTKLALMDERQSKMIETQERIFGMIEKLEGRVNELEKSDTKHTQAATWVFAAVSGAAGLCGMYIAKSLGIL